MAFGFLGQELPKNIGSWNIYYEQLGNKMQNSEILAAGMP
jgi:hypothetical protein